MAHKLVLIDGHALAYRVFFGLPLEAFTTQSGEPTNATFGFTRTLMDLMLAADPPAYLAVSFDVGKTFRDEMFPEYKGTREKMPDELAVQIDRIKQIVAALNIPILELDGYEADDVLGTIAQQAKGLKVPVHIITGDRDLLQLVDENTTVELPQGQWDKGPQVFDTAESVIRKLGVRPNQVVDYKAIVGDTSDNIPGVKGVGEKTVVNLLAEYDTLEGIYANLEAVPTRFRNKLADGRANADLSYQLAKIALDAPITLDLEACVTHEFEREPVLALFREVEFRSLTRRLEEGTQPTTPTAPPPPDPAEAEESAAVPKETAVVLVQTAAALQKLAAVLSAAPTIAFDLETTGLDPLTAEIVGMALAVQEGQGYYIPVGHLAARGQVDQGQLQLFHQGQSQLAENQLPLDEVLAAVRPALTNPAIRKVAHNAKYDYAILARYGLPVAPISFDTMLGEWLINASNKFLGLKDLARERLGVEMTEITSLMGKGKEQIGFAEVDIALAAPYAAADADMTLRLDGILRPALHQKGLDAISQLEMELIPVIAAMEKEGIGIDQALFREIGQRLDEQIQAITQPIYTIAGREFNLNSTQQLSDVLFKELDLPHERLRKTKSGHFSTASDVLENLIEQDETGIAQKMLEYREMQKLKSTYVDALPTMIHPRTGRIHTSFSQIGAETGRLASSNPNLQNIPIRTEAGRQIRRGFVARPGWLFVAADYSQVELRILAHASGDAALIAAFQQDQDIHRATAAAVFGIPVEKVTFEQRRFAKSVNFGLIYGMGAFRLARDSELTLAEADEFIAAYFKQFPGIKGYLDGTKALAAKQGYVETLLGRRRYFPALLPRSTANHNERARAEREAINHPIQGTAADIIKLAMVNIHRTLQDGDSPYHGRMLLQIHDELIFETPEDEAETLRELVVSLMSSAYTLRVPLKVEASIGRSWYALKE